MSVNSNKENMSLLNQTDAPPSCFHCGESCERTNIVIEDKSFCCNGCKTVFELLESNDMCSYYALEENPGTSPVESGIAAKFAYLDDADIQRKLINFTDGESSTITFYIPSMHCASCVWLLESLYRLTPIIKSTKVNFLKKELTATFTESPTALRELVQLLTSIGYEPQINLGSLNEEIKQDDNKDLYIKIGVAGFCFANIMLLSFPQYLVGAGEVEPGIEKFFGVLMILLSLPVFFYSAQDYFRSALQGWKQKHINMDVPISLGILTLFIRSITEIVTGGGHGFMDSFAGLVFLLLIGKMFERKTYDTLSFERDYKSYFPVSVTKKTAAGEENVSLEKLKIKDRIIVRNHELVPADAVLMSESAYIDYSFVTGESNPVEKHNGELIFAGGKQIGSAIELEVIKEVNQSYLTQLWNDDAFTKAQQGKLTTLANSISKYFTIIVISLAALSALFWARINLAQSLNAFTAVLIVACPCALALSTPFTLGNTLRIFGRKKFYLKNTAVIEALAKITMVVFDKTGTITRSHSSKAEFKSISGERLTPQETAAIYSVARQSSHPLSQQIAAHLKTKNDVPVINFSEIPGKGAQATAGGVEVKIGSKVFVGLKESDSLTGGSTVYISINGTPIGRFEIANEYRNGLSETVKKLTRHLQVRMLTGDGENEKKNLLTYFNRETDLRFNQMPIDKLDYIKEQQKAGQRVLMLGDGLNDAGALKQSDVGISVSEDINAFSPASDAILDAAQFDRLAGFISFSKLSMRIILASFGISFLYNIIGLGFAMSGTLSPLIAAVLMPASSITVILFTTGMTTLFAQKRGLL
jgi:P-type Cu+ transporter